MPSTIPLDSAPRLTLQTSIDIYSRAAITNSNAILLMVVFFKMIFFKPKEHLLTLGFLSLEAHRRKYP